jgi:hypothetical protein
MPEPIQEEGAKEEEKTGEMPKAMAQSIGEQKQSLSPN